MRNAEYMPVAQLPVLDLGAQYEAAKARREEAELRKLDYLNQFQQTRGRIAEGVRPEVEKLWNQLQDNLASGDMSFEAKKERQAVYNQYKSLAADAIDWTRELDDREATILSNPTLYKDPATLLKALEQDRLRPVDAAGIPAAISSLPSLSKFLRYQAKEMTPGAIAGTIMERLSAGGGLQDIYDSNTGQLDSKKLRDLTKNYFAANGLTEDEQQQALAYVMRKDGALSDSFEDISKIGNIDEQTSIETLNRFEGMVNQALENSLRNNIETETEKNNKELALYRAKLIMQQRFSKDSGGKPAPVFNLFASDVPVLRPKISPGTETKAPVATSFTKGNAGLIFNYPVSGEKPSYIDPENNRKYTVNYAGVSATGEPMLVATYSVRTGTGQQRVVSEAIPATEEILSSLSNVKTADAIRAALQQLNYTYSEWAKSPVGIFNRAGANMRESMQQPQGLPPMLNFDYDKYKQTYLGQ
jgi:hypothetical protein